MEPKLEGNLIIIGGAEDKKGEKEILKEVCSKLDRENEKLVIATVATELPEEVGKEYTKIFKNLGVKNISILDIQDRAHAFEEKNVNMLKAASIVFFTGGDQLKITSLLGGTPLYKVIKDINEEGCIFVGTSAGASVMSDTMIISGADDDSPKKCTIKMAPGLGLIKDVIIDQHFAQRGRVGRLLGAIAENPECLGIGIDEDTAIEVSEKGYFKVLGSGAVYVIDASEISFTNVSEQNPEEILSMFNVKMHVLKSNDRFDLTKRQPFENEEEKNENK
ncbi:cyanophycinase [Clostridium tunisiense]|uniref:cyanophycinase n=1 Tax=Clostridium tunisiense TaxID=219748 RepID=UPI0002F9B178|nr:cyanophycinase [Clostridium tunisiense]